ncbi:TonB-dependent receptor [Paraglaciecola aquimarina]|uniref:TonB-dependent receptor n=1 Tax=Paraglaciecola algarum TaxID=3050085 RepID=A0ABS9D3S9_9ALTE|nr:TonB-dependent receptor [Paraglaciecola sp. G1-23]MCF2947541.1 TonB-dependent receptor [Paraglaciecola sp. G1-23]
MNTQFNKITRVMKSNTAALCGTAMLAMLSAPAVTAQEAATDDVEVIEVSGIRSSLTSALLEKREATNLIEVIQADDVGKLPDQNLAEVLENITGIQITRTAGVGTGVQIRGTNSNRVEINGVSTVGSGSGRSGISFEDVNASIISSVEVTKAPDAKTIEGSVGGTVNLRTIRPLELSETLGSVRVQLEDSSLSTESATPRFSGAFGDNWETDAGKFGFVASGSYTEQEAVSFRPRTDRDNLSNIEGVPEFQGIQFLVQEQENDDYETLNLATTFEWAPNADLKFHFDAIINEQERSRDNYRIQASGVSSFREYNTPTAFETINYGTVGGVNIGSYQAALSGTIGDPLLPTQENPNLRFSSETGSRITDSTVFILGGEWQGENLKVSAEISSSSSDTTNPTLSTTVNFINPNCDIEGNSRNENCTPFIYDLSGGSLAWGINFDSPWAPSVADLTNPANVVLDQVDVGRNINENAEDAFRVDFEYYVDTVDFINTVDFGFRYNKSSHKFEDIDDRIGGFSQMKDSPNGTLFAELLVKGPTNYGDADGRDLFISNFLLLDPDRSFSDPAGTLKILQDAVIAHDPDSPDILKVESDKNAFRDIKEETTALYVQANFELNEMIRGNIGVRYIETDIDSTGYGPNDTLETTSGSYDFLLPRLNLVITPHDDVVVRLGYGTDINRPGFNRLATGYSLAQDENSVVALGNPGLQPEEVDSFDIGVEWYFAEAAVASIGYFKKERTNIFGIDFEGAALLDDPNNLTGGLSREPGPSCPGGGFYNPTVIPGILASDPNQIGMCVDLTKPGNDPDTTTQTGIEMAFQYDLSSFEDDLGWASGFGILANYTIQDFSGGSIVDSTSGRGLQVLGDVSIDRGLLDFSENAYNFTLYYEKFGLSARMRYTWREAFRTQDFGGGANTSGSSTLSFPVVTADRGQLNASISYDVTEQLNIGLEAVNLTEERIDQYCVAENALLCFVGLPDRRLTLGASYRF